MVVFVFCFVAAAAPHSRCVGVAMFLCSDEVRLPLSALPLLQRFAHDASVFVAVSNRLSAHSSRIVLGMFRGSGARGPQVTPAVNELITIFVPWISFYLQLISMDCQSIPNELQ